MCSLSVLGKRCFHVVIRNDAVDDDGYDEVRGDVLGSAAATTNIMVIIMIILTAIRCFIVIYSDIKTIADIKTPLFYLFFFFAGR